MSKKFFIIIAVILVIFLLALGGYYFILQSNNTLVTTGKVPSFKNFFPFGGNNGTTPPPTGNRPVVDENIPIINFAMKLRKISVEPVAGFGLIDVKAGTFIRHIEKSTGHIYETELFSPRQERISNTTNPTVYDALWGNNGNTVVAFYLKDDNETINAYSLSLKHATSTESSIASSTSYTVTGTLLPGNIMSAAVLGNNMFYLVDGKTSSTGFVSNIDGSKKKQIWSSPIREVLPQFVNSTTIALTTKSHPSVDGYVYFVNSATGSVKKILGNIPGLSTLVSPDAKKVIGISQIKNPQMFVYNVAGETTNPLTPATFPEKCVWSKKNIDIMYCAVPKQFLDAGSLTNWYMGFASYTDDIWKYDVKTNTSNLIENLSIDGGEEIDVTKPTLSDNEQYLVFINKRNGSLWSLDLTQ